MKTTSKTRFPMLLLALPLLTLLLLPGSARAQEQSGHAATAQASVPPEETPSEMEAFRHSPAVEGLARRLHMSTETAATVFEYINRGVVIAVILWFVFRTVPKIFRKRGETLQKQLLDARLAAAEANERLAVVEERLSKLDIDIEAIRRHTEQDSLNDEKRIQESLEAERQRIVASAGQEIEAAGATAQRELKKFAAQLAVDRARQGIRLGPEGDRLLIRSFGENLKGERN